MDCSHPKIGLVSPEEFIPIAEKSGDIITIGYFLFDECCRQIKEWEAMGIELTESSMIDENECIAKLTRIKELGLTVSIDDVGKAIHRCPVLEIMHWTL